MFPTTIPLLAAAISPNFATDSESVIRAARYIVLKLNYEAKRGVETFKNTIGAS